jgi:hypothetical protein
VIKTKKPALSGVNSAPRGWLQIVLDTDQKNISVSGKELLFSIACYVKRIFRWINGSDKSHRISLLEKTQIA